MTWTPNPEVADGSETGGRAEPGEYTFMVDNAVDKVFRSGSEGIALTLLVSAFKDRDVSVFENLVFVDAAQWKIKQFCDSVGLDYNKPVRSAAELIGARGVGNFVLNDRGYLEVEAFLPATANNAPTAAADTANKPSGRSLAILT